MHIARAGWIGMVALVGLAVAGACGSDTNQVFGSADSSSSGAPGGAGGAGSSQALANGGNAGTGGTPSCGEDGASCGDKSVCAGGVCCKLEHACGASCCATAQVCSFQKCLTPGNVCGDVSECAKDEYCDFSLGQMGMGGAGGSCMSGAAPSGKCLPRPPVCKQGEKPGDPPVCLEKCQYKPPPMKLAPKLNYAWGGVTAPPYDTDIMMAPIVVQLDDDDCDGKITERDIPEIVFSTFANNAYNGAGVTHAISVTGGMLKEKWSAPGVFQPTRQIAGGNFDGKPGNEIVGCGSDGTVKALDAAGKPLWSSPPTTCLMPAIADLDQDGDVEIIVEGAILDGKTGQIEHAYSEPPVGPAIVSDIDGDGKLDIVTASQAFNAQGTLFVSTGLAITSSFPGTSDWKAAWPAVADFDKDGKPEVVVVHNVDHAVLVWRYDPAQPQKFSLVRQPIDLNGNLSPTLCPQGSWGRTHGGGPPTVADFNGDGTPDVALAGGIAYTVFDGKKLLDPNFAGIDTFIWQKQTTDCSSASTGSTVFDFDGDGVAEVIYSDEQRLRVYDGPTGTVLFDTCNTTATLIEYPLVADVDNDGHADIIAISNAYAITCDGTKQAGVRVFGSPDASWVRTRRVWNEHAYHITNTGEDGSVPAKEAPNFSQPGLDNFRTNKQPGSEFAAPDALVRVEPKCLGDYGLFAVVRNLGEAALPAGVEVGVYAGTPPTGMLLGKKTTTRALYSLESETLVLLLPNPPPGVKNGATPVYAVVDDSGKPHPSWFECRTDNNVSDPASAKCDIAN